MIVKDNSRRKIYVGGIKIGECFQIDESIYMRTCGSITKNALPDGSISCVDIKTGIEDSLNKYCVVVPIDTYVTVSRE